VDPVLLAALGKTYEIHFEDDDATLDSTYNAVLTFSTSDEPLPGATAQASLVVNLSARPTSGTTSVDPTLPTALRYYAPRPNPLTRGTRFAFDLPQTAPVRLDVYDLSGRRVASLAEGETPAGRHEIFWDTSTARGGRLSAGVYFARFVTPGLSKTDRLVVLP
jgi:hypothetical protein